MTSPFDCRLSEQLSAVAYDVFFPRKHSSGFPSMNFPLIGSFAPAQEPLPSRLFRRPRGFPARGVRPLGLFPSIVACAQ